MEKSIEKEMKKGCRKCGRYPEFTKVYIEKYDGLCRWCSLSEEERERLKKINNIEQSQKSKQK